MNNIEDFVIRDMSQTQQIETTFLRGKEGLLEYIKQIVKIEKNVLWWDYDFGLDLTNMNETTIVFWLRKCLTQVPFIEELLDVKTSKKGYSLTINYSIKFVDQTIVDSEIKIK